MSRTVEANVGAAGDVGAFGAVVAVGAVGAMSGLCRGYVGAVEAQTAW